MLSQTIDQTYPHLSAALDGVAKFSDTIGKRDEQITHLLAQANQVASVLGDRSEQIDRLFVNSNTLLAAFNERSRAISALLGNVSAFSAQVQNLINDNPNLNHVLEQLRTVSDLLVARKDDLAQAVTMLGKTIAAFNETVASGPYFKVSLANWLLTPYWVMQPWVDAAFKKRGLDPGGVLAQRGAAGVPVPRPQRHPVPQRCAAAGATGVGGHPGSSRAGRPAGIALLVRPGRRRACRRPVNSAALRGMAGVGPFGDNGRCPAPPDVLSSPPNPNGLPPTPGIPIAGRPGEPPPNVPGTPVPIAPGPPGARTEPLGPPGPVPPPSTFAPGLPPGPPAPPGPGNQLPAPFIPPGRRKQPARRRGRQLGR